MTPTIYAGALQPKKKAELQEIALALHISDQGTKEDLQSRIKKHFDENPSLEDDPVFSGLFSKRKRSVQPSLPPQSRIGPSAEPAFLDEGKSNGSGSARTSRRVATLDAVQESTPAKELRDVSTMLKDTFPVHSTPLPSATLDTPVSALQFTNLNSPLRSPLKTALEVSRREVDVIVDMVKRKEDTAVRSTKELVVNLRVLLSNSMNIWSLTAFLELSYILRTIIPWETFQLPLSPTATSRVNGIHIPYPPLVVFQTANFWVVLLHWVLPTLLLPSLVGIFVSFRPATSSSKLPFDVLSASIVRLAAQLAYPYPKVPVRGADVLGYDLRVLSAGICLAFAFAEAIARAPASVHLEEKQVMDTQGRHDLDAASLTND